MMLFNYKKAGVYDALDGILPLMFLLTIYITFSQNFAIWGVLKLSCILFSIIWLFLFFTKLSNTIFRNYFVAFLLLQVFSVFSYVYNDRPLSCYFSEASNYLLPMLFVFVGMADSRPNTSFYDKLMYFGSAVLLLGVICYILSPSWYVQSMLNVRNNMWFANTQHNESSILEVMRFNAFFQDSYPVSHYSVFCLAIALFNVFRVDEKKRASVFCVLIALVSAFLCQHRVAIVFAVVLFIAFLICAALRNDNVIKKMGALPILLCLAVFWGVDYHYERIGQIVDLFSSRIDEGISFSKAYSERKLTTELLSEMSFFFFGHGVGAGGAAARFSGYTGVTDMNYVKMFFETGFIGFGSFLALIFFSLKRAVRYYNYYAIEISIILFVLCAMIGSNSLCLYYMYIIPFWYALGKIWNDVYLNIAIMRNIRLK